MTDQFGTLGSGNHFVEVCLDERDRFGSCSTRVVVVSGTSWPPSTSKEPRA